MTRWSTRAADATMSLGIAFKLKNYVLTPALQRDKLLSTGRDPHLVGEVKFEAATAAAVAAAFGHFHTHLRCC